MMGQPWFVPPAENKSIEAHWALYYFLCGFVSGVALVVLLAYYFK
jgi:hypothetical protein